MAGLQSKLAPPTGADTPPPAPVAGLQVLLCGSPPASDPLTAGTWRIPSDVPRQ